MLKKIVKTIIVIALSVLFFIGILFGTPRNNSEIEKCVNNAIKNGYAINIYGSTQNYTDAFASGDMDISNYAIVDKNAYGTHTVVLGSRNKFMIESGLLLLILILFFDFAIICNIWMSACVTKNESFRCSYCGCRLSDKSNFCPGCGHKLNI